MVRLFICTLDIYLVMSTIAADSGKKRPRWMLGFARHGLGKRLWIDLCPLFYLEAPVCNGFVLFALVVKLVPLECAMHYLAIWLDSCRPLILLSQLVSQ